VSYIQANHFEQQGKCHKAARRRCSDELSARLVEKIGGVDRMAAARPGAERYSSYARAPR